MMRNSPLILMFFCTAFIGIPGTHATDDVWKSESHFQPKNFKPHSSNDDFFDFDAYDATMESLNTADQQAERDVNAYLDGDYGTISLPPQPILENIVPLNRSDEDNPILKQILAISLKTADLEQTQRDIDTVKKKEIKLNNQVGELTELVEQRSAEKEKAWKVYMSFTGSDPEIETLEGDGEKVIKRKAHETEKKKALDNWGALLNLHIEAKVKLEKLEAEEASMGEQHQALAEKLESLKKGTNNLGDAFEGK